MFFENDPVSYEKTKPPAIPACFSFLFGVFMSLRSTSESGITYTEIKSYCDLTRTHLSQYELDLLFKMSAWANQKIEEIREEE